MYLKKTTKKIGEAKNSSYLDVKYKSDYGIIQRTTSRPTYFCRANANEFNYSSNPTYLSRSQVRVKEVKDDQPLTFATTVGLYGANNELLAVAKLSEPLKKTPSNEYTLRVRLDY